MSWVSDLVSSASSSPGQATADFFTGGLAPVIGANPTSQQTVQTAGMGALLGGTAGMTLGALGGIATGGMSPPKPNLLSPDALSSTPTVQQTNTTALQAIRASESAASLFGGSLAMSNSSGIYSARNGGNGFAGAGLMDNSTTTSRILLGS